MLLIVAALMTLLLATLLYFTGRGVGHHAPWARIIAMGLSIGLAMVSCGLAAVMDRNVAPLAAVPIGLSLYTLWVLIWRFV